MGGTPKTCALGASQAPSNRPSVDPIEWRISPKALASLEVDPVLSPLIELIANPPRCARVLVYVSKQVKRRQRFIRERFRESTGLDVVEVICAAKTRRAALRARDTEDKVETIARSEGFGDRTAFWRAFRRRCGLGLAEYRAWARAKKLGDQLTLELLSSASVAPGDRPL